MAKQTINVGSAANDGTGDTLRAAFTKTNQNFTEVYGTAQAAFNAANSFNSIDGAFAQAAYTKANGAYGKANSAATLAQAAFDQANTGTGSTGDIRFDGTWIHNKDNGDIYISPQDGQTWVWLPSDTQSDTNAVRVANASANGGIQLQASNKVWTFNHEGKIQLPNGSMIEPYQSGSALFAQGPAVLYSNVSGGSDAVKLRAKGDGGDSTVVLTSDGTLTVPGVITGTEQSSTWTDTITNLIAGTNTYVDLANNHFSGPTTGQITISGVNAPLQLNGTWYYQASESNQIQLFNDVGITSSVNSSEWAGYAGGGTVENTVGGGLSLQANYNTWDFQADGTLKVPGNIVVGSPPNTSGKEQHLIIDAQNYWTSIQWKNMTSLQTPGSSPFECQAQLLRVFANDNTVTSWCNVQNPREELVALTAIQVNNTKNGLMFSTSDGKIPDAPYNDGTGARHDWVLHGDGTTKFPYLPTNARTGNADALIFTKIDGQTGQKVIGTQGGTAQNPTVERLVIAGGDGYGSGEGGDIYLWAGRSSLDANGQGQGGGDIKVDAGDAYDIDGGTVKIRGGNSWQGNNNLAHPGGWIEIDAGSSYNGGNGADIYLNAGNSYNGNGTDGKVRVTTGKGSHNFDFNNDGTLSANCFLASTGGAGTGYTFQGDGGYDTGMFSTSDGVVQFYANAQEVFNFNTTRLEFNKPITLGDLTTANAIGSGDPAYPTVLDLTKTVNKLTDNTSSKYTLADGTEGQIMHLVPKNGATTTGIYVEIANARILRNADRSTSAEVITNAAYFPFYSSTDNPVLNIATLIFTDGAWNVSTGAFDY